MKLHSFCTPSTTTLSIPVDIYPFIIMPRTRVHSARAPVRTWCVMAAARLRTWVFPFFFDGESRDCDGNTKESATPQKRALLAVFVMCRETVTAK